MLPPNLDPLIITFAKNMEEMNKKYRNYIQYYPQKRVYHLQEHSAF
jgi:hypothetical protein